MLFRSIEVVRSAKDPLYMQVKVVEEMGDVTHPTPPYEQPVSSPGAGLTVDFPCAKLVEIPWGILEPPEQFAVTMLAGRAQGLYTQARLVGGLSEDSSDVMGNIGFVMAGKLVAEYPADTKTVDDVGFLISPGYDTAGFAVDGSITRSQLYQRGNLLVIGNEIMAVQIVELANADPIRYRLRGVIRGLWDTQAATHALNSCEIGRAHV